MSTSAVEAVTAPSPIAAVSVRRLEEPKDEDRTLFDLVLRGQDRLSKRLIDESFLPQAVQKLTVLSLVGFAVHGLVVGVALQWARGAVSAPSLPVLWMPLAFPLAFLGALSVCLPSFYFYTQLSGFDASFRLVTAQALRTNATTSVLLLGIAPFFAAYALACGLGYLGGGAEAIYTMGFVLPFVVGVFGLRALYRSFCDLSTVLPQTTTRRGNVLRRMILCWGGIYAVIAPIALWRLADKLPIDVAALISR